MSQDSRLDFCARHGRRSVPIHYVLAGLALAAGVMAACGRGGDQAEGQMAPASEAAAVPEQQTAQAVDGAQVPASDLASEADGDGFHQQAQDPAAPAPTDAPPPAVAAASGDGSVPVSAEGVTAAAPVATADAAAQPAPTQEPASTPPSDELLARIALLESKVRALEKEQGRLDTLVAKLKKSVSGKTSASAGGKSASAQRAAAHRQADLAQGTHTAPKAPAHAVQPFARQEERQERQERMDDIAIRLDGPEPVMSVNATAGFQLGDYTFTKSGTDRGDISYRYSSLMGLRPAPASRSQIVIDQKTDDRGAPVKRALANPQPVSARKTAATQVRYYVPQYVDVDQVRREKYKNGKWSVKAITQSRAVIYHSGADEARNVVVGSEVPNLGVVSEIDPDGALVKTSGGTIGR